MENEEAVQLAKKIIELDLLRDEIWEYYAALTGDDAHKLLRLVQNS
ncbi:hypothetical protein MKX67_13435 [Cytobacillus sp. FSL W7-1323]|uniref:Uncharacterized protein n=1 Tax=Cytobacillus stercorigallinarum TaxID=2762240 RepID=A0ABR8QVU7_9BACI|nr:MULTISPECIES: hypothetical protein [Cytobacillus]MBD7939613.1 hypothetical protein [Cytobacillus stercorigallinarum]MCA1028279.1 hypothetical protein [Cytobacillus kochii]MCM3321035.1 hypothetical protein [Cytobacillus kochii]MCM3344132.1 hypothetical protein [Cytobacillus kochii]MDM5207976.1 hypothetical protein [Cytobacillus kochii]